MTAIWKKALAAGGVVLTLAGAAVTPARAGHDGGAIAAGVLGGLAVGAIAGSAAANSNPYYGAPAYAAPAYAAPPPGPCYWTRQRVYDDYGYVVGSRRVRVCD